MVKKPTEGTTPDKKPIKKAVAVDKAKTKTTVAKRPARTASADKAKAKKVAAKVGSEAAIKSMSVKTGVEKTTAPARKKTEEQPVAVKKPSVRRVTLVKAPEHGQEPAKQEEKKPAFLRESVEEVAFQPFIQEAASGEHGRHNKRNNRRRNKRGNSGQGDHVAADLSAHEVKQKKLCKKAWKIFAAEVGEEGLVLMDDNTSREAARRAFRVAELFLMEETRRKHALKQASHHHHHKDSSEPEEKQEQA